MSNYIHIDKAVDAGMKWGAELPDGTMHKRSLVGKMQGVSQSGVFLSWKMIAVVLAAVAILWGVSSFGQTLRLEDPPASITHASKRTLAQRYGTYAAAKAA
ncbi:MAG: hypothetical protein KDC00_14215, partial [Flavobacteriales bacterium]|nr:hypothetical protein [Flavobacteriales bacterium]